MSQVVVDKALVDFLLYGFIAAIIGLIAVVMGFVIQEHWRTPPESKLIRKAYNRKKAIVTVEGDDGFTDMLLEYKSGPEGMLETTPDKNTKIGWTGLAPRITETPEVQAQLLEGNSGEQFEADKTVEIQKFLGSLASHKSYLRGARVPILHAYKGKVILTHLQQVLGIQALEKMKTLYPQQFVSVDLTEIKKHFPMAWDQTQLAAQGEIKRREGYLQAKKEADNKPFQKVLLMLIVMFGLIVAAIILLRI